MSKKSSLNPFLVIEALDAGGSQTQTDLLVKHLKREKYKTLQLHFPQEDRPTGRLVYDKFLLSKNKGKLSRREQALIYIQDFYSRSEDIQTARASRVVVSDRYCTSTFAYQTMGLQGREYKKMLQWLLWLAYEDTPALPRPNLVVFLDTPVAVSLRRLKGKPQDHFEEKNKLVAIRNNYLKLARQQGWRVLQSVDKQGNERTREELHEEVWQVVKPFFSR